MSTPEHTHPIIRTQPHQDEILDYAHDDVTILSFKRKKREIPDTPSQQECEDDGCYCSDSSGSAAGETMLEEIELQSAQEQCKGTSTTPCCSAKTPEEWAWAMHDQRVLEFIRLPPTDANSLEEKIRLGAFKFSLACPSHLVAITMCIWSMLSWAIFTLIFQKFTSQLADDTRILNSIMARVASLENHTHYYS